jgi:hypothetical protein
MQKNVKKRFTIFITQAKQTVNKTFELDKTALLINGLVLTSDKDDLLYYRGEQKIEINGEEYFPEDYESKLLMSGINVSPNSRYYNLGGVLPGNGTIKLLYQDVEDGRSVFTPYRVSLYIDYTVDKTAN